MATEHARPPIHRLKKVEITWLANHTCQAHRKAYLEHYNCYLREQPGRQEKIGFLDIECTGLQGDWGYMLSYCILDDASGDIIYDVITPQQINASNPGFEDREVVKSCIHNMFKFDRVVTFYGARYDIPMIRTRALVTGVPMPGFGTLKHTDVYFMAKHKLKLSSNRQENVCRNILGSTDKTRVEPLIWKGAARGRKDCLKYILDHNMADVCDLQKIYHKLMPFVQKRDTSI